MTREQEFRAEAQTREQKLAGALGEAEAHGQRFRARAERLEAEARDATGSRRGAFDAQLRRAQMQALQAIADIGEDLHRAASGDTSGVVRDVYERLLRIAGELGLEPLEEPDVVVPFDRGRHRLLDGTNAISAKVIEPAWGFEQNGSVVVVRYGVVAAV